MDVITPHRVYLASVAVCLRMRRRKWAGIVGPPDISAKLGAELVSDKAPGVRLKVYCLVRNRLRAIFRMNLPHVGEAYCWE